MLFYDSKLEKERELMSSYLVSWRCSSLTQGFTLVSGGSFVEPVREQLLTLAAD